MRVPGLDGTSIPRLSQEWSAIDSTSAPCSWVHVGDHAERHDPSHLVTHRAVMGLPELLDMLGSGSGSGPEGPPCTDYAHLLLALDAEAGLEIDAALGSIRELSEPQVARQLSRQLPPGESHCNPDVTLCTLTYFMMPCPSQSFVVKSSEVHVSWTPL